jgi:hypothetical protein
MTFFCACCNSFEPKVGERCQKRFSAFDGSMKKVVTAYQSYKTSENVMLRVESQTSIATLI